MGIFRDPPRIRPKAWALYTLVIVATYPLLWVSAMVIRFGTWPNYLHVYDVLEAYRLTWSGTPSWTDAIAIAMYEPWLEVGYMSPQWGISEWSYMLIPPKLLLVVLLAAALALILLLRKRAGMHVAADAGAATGTLLVGLAAASLFWVVCCANPTWVVALAMLGVDADLALTVEPLGPFMSGGGLLLLTGSLLYYLRRPVRRYAVL